MKTLRKRLLAKASNASYKYKRVESVTSWGERSAEKMYVFQFKGGLPVTMGTKHDSYITPSHRTDSVLQLVGEKEGRVKPKYEDSWF